jgi:hypothetical protein
MDNQFNILVATAKSYLILAINLKKKGICYQHYLFSAKKCMEKANQIKQKEVKIADILEYSKSSLEVTAIIQSEYMLIAV